MESKFDKKAATTAMDTISNFIKENPKTVAAILGAGGLGAIGGAALPGAVDENETAGQRVLRRVKNALIGGALGAGSAAAVTGGAKLLSGGKPSSFENVEAPITPGAQPKGAEPATGEAGSAWPGAIAGGGAGAVITAPLAKLLAGATNTSAQEAADALTHPLASFGALRTGKGPVAATQVRDVVRDILSGDATPAASAVMQNSQWKHLPTKADQLVHQLSKAELSHVGDVAHTTDAWQLARALGPGNKVLKAKLYAKPLLRLARKGGPLGILAAGAATGAASLPAIVNALNKD